MLGWLSKGPSKWQHNRAISFRDLHIRVWRPSLLNENTVHNPRSHILTISLSLTFPDWRWLSMPDDVPAPLRKHCSKSKSPAFEHFEFAAVVQLEQLKCFINNIYPDARPPVYFTFLFFCSPRAIHQFSSSSSPAHLQLFYCSSPAIFQLFF